MVHSSDDDAEKVVGSRYSLVIAVAKRAKQLRDGAPKLVDSRSRNHITVALEEIAEGKVKVIAPTPELLEAMQRRREVPARPGVRETADLLRVPEGFEETEGEKPEPPASEAILPIAEEELKETPTGSPAELGAESGEAEMVAESEEEETEAAEEESEEAAKTEAGSE